MADHHCTATIGCQCQTASASKVLGQGRTGGRGQDALCLCLAGMYHRLIHPHPECTSLHTTYPFSLLHVPARSLNPKQKTALQKLARTNSHPFHALP